MDISSLSFEEFEHVLSQNNMSHHQAGLLTPVHPFDKSRAALFVAYSLLLLVGVAGNAWVACVIVCVLRTSRRNQSPSSVQIYILALCCCDLVVLAFLAFLLLDLAFGRWIVPSTAVCQLYLCSESLNKFCGPFILTAMSAYCYYTVCWPEKAGTASVGRVAAGVTGCGAVSNTVGFMAVEGKRAVALVCACVLFVLILISPVYVYGGIHYLIAHNNTVVKTVLSKCTLQPPENILTLFTAYSFVLGYLVPALLFTYFYTAILFRVRRRPRAGTGGEPPLHFWRVAKNCMILVLFYLVCWTAYWCLNLYHFVAPLVNPTNRQQDGIVLSYYIHMLPYINCTGYPILYTFINRNIKTAYSQVKEDRKKRRRDRKLRKLDCASKHALATSGFGSSSVANEASSVNCQVFHNNTNLETTVMVTNGHQTGYTVKVDEETLV